MGPERDSLKTHTQIFLNSAYLLYGNPLLTQCLGVKEIAPRWIVFQQCVYEGTLTTMCLCILIYNVFYNSVSSEISFLFLKPI